MREAKAVQTRALVKRIREKGKERKRRKKEALDRLNERKKARRAVLKGKLKKPSRA